ncbi:hypothetical protein GCM10009122_36620 [Fulvivirga kasyanovii]|uniref:T9SS type A sorting domain-containing protein n=1 Tax=Fulvivirga kasyanovii TaxID=396812 RepID=A0ABW9RYW8_9BACT|nr:LamG-like jellyroll fold domain-containing protein [Fulvivirga kasyanovii]MTI29151.1 T9SS type A sorting domain-containing protein [Fulvivirga kasyanovii]
MRLRQNQKPTVKTSTSVVLKYAALGLLTIVLIFSAVFIYNNFINIGDTRAEGDEGAMDGGGFALYMDGSGDYVALQSYEDSKGSLPQLTVEAWVSIPAGDKGDQVMPVIDFDGGEYYSLYVNGKNGKVYFITTGEDGSEDETQSKSTKVNDGNWHHVAAVYDGNDKILYIDGKEVSRTNSAHKRKALGTGATRYGFIGAQSEANSFDGNTGKNFFKGSIDEVRVWSVAKSQEDIRQKLTEKLTGEEENLYMHLSLNEGEGNEIKEAVQNKKGALKGDLSGAGWVASGIYMGDQSIYDYNNYSLSYTIEGKGTVTVDITSGSPEGIHIYFVKESPNYVTIPDGMQALEGFYWGVYAMGDVEYSFSYDFSNYTGDFDPLAIELVERQNSASDWANSGAYKMAGQSQMMVPNQKGTEYALASSAVVMPIELARFDAKVKGADVEVTWTTSSELNNDFFTIERSRDGKDYEIAGVVEGAGNSEEPLSYSYTDSSPFSGRSYYRLKQTDYDGKFEYFAPVMVEKDNVVIENVQLTVYPNPSLNQVITVVVEGLADGSEARVAMMDLQGNAVFTEDVASNGIGNVEVKIDPSSISGGNYLVVVTTASDKYTKQVILRK